MESLGLIPFNAGIFALIHRDFRANCTKKKAAFAAFFWCGKQDLNLHES